MPTVRDASRVAARAAVLVVLCAAVVGCGVWASVRWGEAARWQVQTEEDERVRAPQPVEDPSAADFPTGPRDIKPLIPRRGSGGGISVRIRRVGSDGTKGQDESAEWRITTTYRLGLGAKDPLVGQLRADPELFSAVAYVLPGGFASAQPVSGLAPPNEALSGNLAGLPTWCTISQPAKDGRVTVTAQHVVTARAEPPATQLDDYNLFEKVPDGGKGWVPRLPGRWTWRLDVSRGWGLKVKGAPEHQTARSVGFRLTTTRGADSVTATLTAAQGGAPEDAEESTSTASRHQALPSLLALFLAVGGALVGFARAPDDADGIRRRARAVAVGAGLLVCAAVGVLLWDLYEPSWSMLLWIQDTLWFERTGLGLEPLPIQARAQAVILGIALFALPVLVTAAWRGAPRPGTGSVLAVALPAPAFVLLAWVMGGADWSSPVAHCLAAATLAAVAVLCLLRLPLWRGRTRSWSVPLAAATWAGVAVAVVLLALPRNLWQENRGAPFTYTRPAVLASWSAVFLLLAPWVVTLVALGGPLVSRRLPHRRGQAAVVGVLLCGALLPWWTQFHKEVYYDLPATSALFLHLTGQSPGDRRLLGVQTVAPALQVIWLVCTVLLLLHLRNTGRESGRWHTSARGGCLALLVLAASATVIGAPESWLPYWTTGAALSTAWAGGALLLLPTARAQRAARLHALSGDAHARLVTLLARALLFAEGRHRFLTSSRATLADSSLPPDDWDAKWQSLKRPTAADASDETTRLRADALGGSAGRDAWTNGVTATAATALLALPWTVWTAVQAHGYSGLPQAVTVAGGPTCVWLAHGFTYGYLYPWLRGNSPVAKAGWLWSVMTTVQLLLLVPKLQVPGDAPTLSVFLLLAQSTVMALCLGLFWEIRLVRRADLLWGHIRNFRRLSSLATPAATVLVAAVAAAVTVLATAWANDVTAPVEAPRPSSSSPSPTPSPGAPP
ncbi:hypothetical protein ABZV77_38590 [Streptomyces sp. NPDC004732]|uniref:hypothetical protein n=1 Tax=Streptomyces sp. NPDC004732 TaxID=3154290 RepID=UPI0033B214F8